MCIFVALLKVIKLYDTIGGCSRVVAITWCFWTSTNCFCSNIGSDIFITRCGVDIMIKYHQPIKNFVWKGQILITFFCSKCRLWSMKPKITVRGPFCTLEINGNSVQRKWKITSCPSASKAYSMSASRIFSYQQSVTTLSEHWHPIGTDLSMNLGWQTVDFRPGT